MDMVDALFVVHGDRIRPDSWWCSWCDTFVQDDHSCGPTMGEHFERAERDLALNPSHPVGRANYWLERAQLFQPPPPVGGFDASDDQDARYISVRWWAQPPESFCVFVMDSLNRLDYVSHANALAAGWGYDASICVAVHPQGGPSSKDVLAMTYVQVAASLADIVVCAWGLIHRRVERALFNGPLADADTRSLTEGRPSRVTRDLCRDEPAPYVFED